MGNRFYLKYSSEVTKQKKQTIMKINSRGKGRTVSKITTNFTQSVQFLTPKKYEI